jgi:hypothetical protein
MNAQQAQQKIRDITEVNGWIMSQLGISFEQLAQDAGFRPSELRGIVTGQIRLDEERFQKWNENVLRYIRAAMQMNEEEAAHHEEVRRAAYRPVVERELASIDAILSVPSGEVSYTPKQLDALRQTCQRVSEGLGMRVEDLGNSLGVYRLREFVDGADNLNLSQLGQLSDEMLQYEREDYAQQLSANKGRSK